MEIREKQESQKTKEGGIDKTNKKTKYRSTKYRKMPEGAEFQRQARGIILKKIMRKHIDNM